MRALILMLAASAVLCIGGCDKKPESRYEMSKDANGRTVRLDKMNGDIAVVESDRVVPLKSSAEVADENAELVKLSGPHYFPAQNLATFGASKAYLTTAWRDGAMQYIFSISPASKKIDDRRRTDYAGTVHFQIEITDANGFVVTSIQVPLNALIQSIDEKGVPAAYEAKGSVILTAERYRAINGFGMQWYGFQ